MDFVSYLRLDLVRYWIFWSLICIVLSLCYFLYLAGAHPKLNRPPEPSGAWPVLGHLRILRGPKLLHEKLSDMAEKHGPIFGLRLGLRRSIVVSDWKLIKELSTTHDKAISSRPQMIAAEHLGYNYAMVAYSPYGSYWREIRKFMALELFSARRIELFKQVRVSEIKRSIQELYMLCVDRRMVEMRQWISDLTTNFMFRIIFGKRYSCGDVDVEARKCQMLFKKDLYLISLNLVGDAIPWLRWLDIGGHEKAMKETFKEFDHLLTSWLDEHHDRRRTNRPQGKEADQDFMYVMISMLKDADIKGFDADTINKATCLILNLGGGDTTATMITWTLCLLMNHPHVLKKVEDELDFHVGKERNVEESDITNLVYLHAVIKESLRLFPPAPLGAPREVTEDCVVGGYHVPSGTRLFINTWKLQRDPNIWSEPSEFRPERFMSTHSNIDVRGQNFELIPFGVGRRICPGINFGLQLGHLVLASLVHSFHISSPNNSPVDMSANDGLTISKATPLELIITPRLCNHLYTSI